MFFNAHGKNPDLPVCVEKCGIGLDMKLVK